MKGGSGAASTALLVIVGIVLGMILVDFKFDFSEDPLAAYTYYSTMKHDKQRLVVPAIVAVSLLLSVKKFFTNIKQTREWMFFLSYFSNVFVFVLLVEPSKEVLLGLDPARQGAEVTAAAKTVGLYHATMGLLCLAALLFRLTSDSQAAGKVHSD